MPFVYSDRYFAEFGEHVFPVEKYLRVYKELKKRGVADSEFYEPQEASREDLLLVHTPAYLEDIEQLKWTQRTMFSELPLTREIITLFKLAAGGTILATELAMQRGYAVHIGGGFHHAFAAKAEGFCYINDLAVAAQKYLEKEAKGRVLVVDLDLHQGNGTAKIFQGERRVFTFSMHQKDIYPVKESSDLDLHLPAGTQDEEYLELLDRAFEKIRKKFSATLILYQAGADPFYQDQLGSLALTKEGLRQRDLRVYEFARQQKAALVVTLGGGYAYDTRHTVDIHVTTCWEAYQFFR
ncbi:MAG: histone deacetylase [candidate division KSB1 bacterium]|nr:histone deacetylase [candidate division KSB1 bacterium]